MFIYLFYTKLNALYFYSYFEGNKGLPFLRGK